MLLKEFRVSVVFDDWKAEGYYIGTSFVYAPDRDKAAQLAMSDLVTDDRYYLGEPTDIEIELVTPVEPFYDENEDGFVIDSELVRG